MSIHLCSWHGMDEGWILQDEDEWCWWSRLVECCFTSTETVDLLGMGAQDGRLDFHTAPALCWWSMYVCMIYRQVCAQPGKWLEQQWAEVCASILLFLFLQPGPDGSHSVRWCSHRSIKNSTSHSILFFRFLPMESLNQWAVIWWHCKLISQSNGLVVCYGSQNNTAKHTFSKEKPVFMMWSFQGHFEKWRHAVIKRNWTEEASLIGMEF